METMPLVMMGIMGLAAGWIAHQLLSGGKGDLVQMLLTGVVGAFVGGHIQRFAKFDVARLGNPLLEELAVATMGAVVVILVARTIAPRHDRHH